MGVFEALGSLFSGALGAYESNENRKMQEQFNRDQLAFGRENMAQQKEFAQHGLSWKIDDAAARGIHPLVALGSQAQSFSPVSVGGSAPQSSSLSGMGQSIERAIKAGIAGEDREKVDEEKARKLQLENAGLQNDILRAKLASDKAISSRISGQIGPPMPVGRIPLPRPGPPRTVDGDPVGDESIKQKPSPHPAIKISRPFGYPLQANPYFEDGQDTENRYGESEVMSTAKAAVNVLADHFYTGWRNIIDGPSWGPKWTPPTHNKPWLGRR